VSRQWMADFLWIHVILSVFFVLVLYIVCMKATGTCKPAHAVTSIKQPPVLKGHIFLPVIENFIWIEPLLRSHLSYTATFSLSQIWPLNTGLTIL
jgi:hypothetical protein